MNGMGNRTETRAPFSSFSPRISRLMAHGPACGLSTGYTTAISTSITFSGQGRRETRASPSLESRHWLGLLERPGPPHFWLDLDPAFPLTSYYWSYCTFTGTCLSSLRYLRYAMRGIFHKRCICLRLGGACTGPTSPSDDSQTSITVHTN